MATVFEKIRRLRQNHFDQKHERRNVPGCPICFDRKAEDVEEERRRQENENL